MLPSDYQKLAERTQCGQPIVYRNNEAPASPYCLQSAILHGALGIASEGGELLAEMQRWIWYKKDLNETNIKEELGDVLWYVAEICNALGWDMGEVMAANISKLKARYPEKYTDHLSAEENRDRFKEAKALRTISDVLKARGTLDGCCKNFPGVPCNCLDTAKLLEGI